MKNINNAFILSQIQSVCHNKILTANQKAYFTRCSPFVAQNWKIVPYMQIMNSFHHKYGIFVTTSSWPPIKKLLSLKFLYLLFRGGKTYFYYLNILRYLQKLDRTSGLMQFSACFYWKWHWNRIDIKGCIGQPCKSQI